MPDLLPLGAMRDRVSLLAEQTTSDGRGGRSVAWVTFATVWAQWNPQHGAEYMVAGVVQDAMRHKVRLRYRSDVTTTIRVRLDPDGPSCEVVQVVNMGQRKRWLMLDVIEAKAT